MPHHATARHGATRFRIEIWHNYRHTYVVNWKTVFNVRFTSGVESFEFICQDGNQAYELMVGSMGKVDRSSPLVP
jgi:hypothetical protein